MGAVTCFEDLIIRQEAGKVINQINRYTSALKDSGFCNPIQRAVLSVMNNIAESYESGSKTTFKKYLFIAKGSCGAVRSMLHTGIDLHYTEKTTAKTLIAQCPYLAVSIPKLILYLKNDNIPCPPALLTKHLHS